MRALVYDEYTTDDDFSKILKIKNIPIPEPRSNEVVFKVISAGCNYDDIWGMRGKPLAIPLPHISGTDAAGIVTAVGNDVKNFKVGDRVVSHGNMSCRVCKACTDGREFDCKKRTIWGFETGPLWGGYCEFTHLPEVNVLKIPEGVSYDDAAAASMTLLTSWHMLVGRAKIQPGQLVLIMGGSSGIGTFGIQIAKLFGCTVIATASPEKLDKCLELGADYAVDHRKDDWHKEVRSIAKKIPKPYALNNVRSHRNLDWLIDIWTNSFNNKNGKAKLFINPNLIEYSEEMKKSNIYERKFGSRDDLINELRNTRVFAYTGHKSDIWVLTVEEAVQMCVPIVTYGIGSVEDRVIHNETGFIAKNDGEFAKYLEMLLFDDEFYNKIRRKMFKRRGFKNWDFIADIWTVSYTHLTLPRKRIE